MKVAVLALALLPLVAPFAPLHYVPVSTFKLASTVAPPERVAPDAGKVPDWEDRPGLSPEEFMESDMSKPDLSGMWECPLTRWDDKECVSVSTELNHYFPPIHSHLISLVQY
jgi:hypothetical protein